MTESTEDRGTQPAGATPNAGTSDQEGQTGDRHDDDVYDEQQIVDPPTLDQA